MHRVRERRPVIIVDHHMWGLDRLAFDAYSSFMSVGDYASEPALLLRPVHFDSITFLRHDHGALGYAFDQLCLRQWWRPIINPPCHDARLVALRGN